MREVLAEKLPRHRTLPHGRALEVRVETLEQSRPALGAGLTRPEAAHLRFAEEVVARELLVGAFAGEHDLDAGLVHQFRQQEERRGRCSKQRTLGVRDDVWKRSRNVLPRHDNLVMVAAELDGHRALEFRSSYSGSANRSEKVEKGARVAASPSAATRELSRPPDR